MIDNKMLTLTVIKSCLNKSINVKISKCSANLLENNGLVFL